MISLHPDAISKAQSLINVGALLCVFPLNLFGRVIEVNENLSRNQLFASDLSDLMWLANILLNHDEINHLLKLDIQDLYRYLDMKVHQFGDIKKACARHTNWLGI
jgi:glycine cleavage system H lipoate-binding protein